MASLFVKRLLSFLLLFSCHLYADVDIEVFKRIADKSKDAKLIENADIIYSIATQFELNPLLLASILKQENGEYCSVKPNANGSLDHGYAQINSVRHEELKKIKINLKDTVCNPKLSIFASAYIASAGG